MTSSGMLCTITVHGYPAREVSSRLGASTHSLYKWVKLRGDSASKTVTVDHAVDNLRLKRELARVTEEREILKNRPRVDARLCAVETPATFACGGELPMAYWRHSTPLKNVAYGPMRT
jgi:transposase